MDAGLAPQNAAAGTVCESASWMGMCGSSGPANTEGAGMGVEMRIFGSARQWREGFGYRSHVQG
jgi:hypothetical protein